MALNSCSKQRIGTGFGVKILQSWLYMTFPCFSFPQPLKLTGEGEQDQTANSAVGMEYKEKNEGSEWFTPGFTML